MDKTAKERMQRYRNKHRNETGSVTGQTVTLYPAIVTAVCDPIKRRKLIRICQELRQHGQLDNVRYGIFGPTFGTVEEIIKVT